MQRSTSSYFLALMLIVYCTAASARSTLLIDPEILNMPDGMSIALIDKAIFGALAEKQWEQQETSDEAPRIFNATHYVRSHKIVIQVRYNNEMVKLSYVDSENMKYRKRKDKETIHPNYNVWVQRLADKMSANIKLGDSYVYDASKLKNDRPSNPAPKEPFSSFTNFRLEPTTLAESFQANGGNKSTRKNLEHNLSLKLAPELQQWQKESGDGRTLIIQPHIEAVRFIGTAARIFAGANLGRSWMYVTVSYIDEASGEIVAKPKLYRLATRANGFSGSRRDYKMVEIMANDIVKFTTSNYSDAVGGGNFPPEKIRQLAQEQ